MLQLFKRPLMIRNLDRLAQDVAQGFFVGRWSYLSEYPRGLAGMAAQRTEPRFEEGRFVPAYPFRREENGFTFVRQLGLINDATKNPLRALSARAFCDPVVQTRSWVIT